MRPGTRPRILFIDDRAPIPSLGAGLPRAWALLLALHQRAALLTHYSMITSDIDLDEAHATLPRDVELIVAQGASGLAGFLRSRRDYYDMLIISRPHNMVVLDDALTASPDLLGRTRLIYDAEAIFSRRDDLKVRVLGKASLPGKPMDLAAELRLPRSAQAIVAVTQAEAVQFTQAGYKNVRVLRHSIDLQPTGSSYENRRDLLFVGRLAEDGSPNADSVRWFAREVMPHLDKLLGCDYRLEIVGACSKNLRDELESSRVRFHGRVADIRPIYEKARLFIAPTRFAAGIPLKIYEAAAYGVPVVATRLLVGQLGWADHKEILGAGTAETFAQACALLYQDRALWEGIRRDRKSVV